jgi:hypothetical protein
VSDLIGTVDGNRHLVIRSLDPILNAAPTARVCRVLDRITGFRSERGLSLIGFQYTAHEEETMTAIAALVDGVLWVSQPSPDRLAFEYQSTRGRQSRSVLESSPDD